MTITSTPRKLTQRPQVLVLSGLDPSGGAGIQADIQAITALGAHPLPVLACLTVQDTRNVYGAEAVDTTLVRQQLDHLAADTPIHAIKTGALGNAAIVDTLLAFLADKPDIPLVVDPVIKAAGGGDLADQALIDAMTSQLFARADLITPNGIELALLGGSDDPDQASAKLIAGGCRAVLATGGHGEGERIVNTLYCQDQASQSWDLQRIGGEYHGTGCTLAAAIAAGYASGLSPAAAIEQAQRFVAAAIAQALAVGRGQPVPDRSVRLPS